MKSRLKSAQLLAEGKLTGQEKADAEANPHVAAEAKRLKNESVEKKPRSRKLKKED